MQNYFSRPAGEEHNRPPVKASNTENIFDDYFNPRNAKCLLFYAKWTYNNHIKLISELKIYSLDGNTHTCVSSAHTNALFILITSEIYIASIPLSNFIINYYFTLILSFVTGLVLLTCVSARDTCGETGCKRDSNGKKARSPAASQCEVTKAACPRLP